MIKLNKINSQKDMDLESKNKINMPPMEDFMVKEDFFNPFDEDDAKPKKSSHIKDSGGILGIRKESYNPSRIEYVKKGEGYIVQARTQFGYNETVEIAPVIILGSEATAVQGLKEVVYELSKNGSEYGLVLGYGSLYSHSDKPNLSYAYNKKTKQMHFITTRPVQYGEPLTINYGADYWVAKKNFNMIAPYDKETSSITRVQPVPIKKELEESESHLGAADFDERKRTAGFMEKKANPAVTGVAIKGIGQQ